MKNVIMLFLIGITITFYEITAKENFITIEELYKLNCKCMPVTNRINLSIYQEKEPVNITFNIIYSCDGSELKYLDWGTSLHAVANICDQIIVPLNIAKLLDMSGINPFIKDTSGSAAKQIAKQKFKETNQLSAKIFYEELKKYEKRFAKKIHIHEIISCCYTSLPKLADQILQLVHTYQKITIAEIIKVTGAPRSTIKKYLTMLINHQYLLRHGQGRNVWYTIAS